MEDLNSKSPHRESRMFLMVAAVTAVICIVILLIFKGNIFIRALKKSIHILDPFLFGAVVAWLLHPVCGKIEKVLVRLTDRDKTGRHKGLLRTVSVILSLVFLFAILVLLLVGILPELISSISGLLRQMPGAIADLQKWMDSLVAGEASEEVIGDLQVLITTVYERLQNFLKTDLLPRMETLAVGVVSSFGNVISVVMNLGIGCIIASYILGSWEKFGAQGRMVIYALFPERGADWIRRELHFANEKFSGFIIGKILDSLIIGLICFVFVSITNMPYGMLVSIIVAVTNMIPFFGPYLGAVPSAVLILTASPGKCVIFLIFIFLLQQLDGNVIGPMILGDRLGLSAFWILFAILVFGSLWGFLGMLIGAPVFAVLYDLIRTGVRTGLKKRKREDLITTYDTEFPHEERSDGKSKKKLRKRLRDKTPG